VYSQDHLDDLEPREEKVRFNISPKVIYSEVRFNISSNVVYNGANNTNTFFRFYSSPICTLPDITGTIDI
jgi:hypothetical protein